MASGYEWLTDLHQIVDEANGSEALTLSLSKMLLSRGMKQTISRTDAMVVTVEVPLLATSFLADMPNEIAIQNLGGYDAYAKVESVTLFYNGVYTELQASTHNFEQDVIDFRNEPVGIPERYYARREGSALRLGLIPPVSTTIQATGKIYVRIGMFPARLTDAMLESGNSAASFSWPEMLNDAPVFYAAYLFFLQDGRVEAAKAWETEFDRDIALYNEHMNTLGEPQFRFMPNWKVGRDKHWP